MACFEIPRARASFVALPKKRMASSFRMPASKLQLTAHCQPGATALPLCSSPLMSLGPRIREARLSANLTVPELARKVGVSKQIVYRWEANEVGYIKPDHLFKIAKITGYSPIWLQNGTGEKYMHDWTDTLTDLMEVWTQLDEDEQNEVLAFARFKAAS